MINGKTKDGYDYEIDEKRIIWFKADQMAKELGLVEKKYRKNGGYSIRWNSLNNLINNIGATSCANNNNMMTIELVSALKSRFFG